MDAAASAKALPINRWLPYWAVLQADFAQTVRSWVYRLWVVAVLGTMVGYLVARAAPAHEFGMLHTASEFMTDLLRWTVLGSITMIVVLTVGCISGERGTMADSVLSRGISRHQYFLGKWHARLAAVLGTFIILAIVAMVTGLFFLHEDLNPLGSLMALGTVSAMLVFVVTAGVTVSAIASSTIFGMALLWIGLYGLGFASTLLPTPFPAPDRALQRLPHILRGNFDPEMLGQLIFSSLACSLLMALVGSIYFARCDV